MARIDLKTVLRHAALWALFVALALAVVWPALGRITWWGVHDWTQFYSYFGVPRRAIVEYHELPGWNPYYYGGSVQWGHPDDPTLSPVFIPVLVFGVIAGLKIDMILVLAGGMYSMWLLARRLSLSWAAGIFAAVVWGLNGWHAYHFAVGHMDHLTFLFQPLAMLFFMKALDDLRWSVAGAAVIALMFLSGGPYPFVFTSVLVTVMGLLFAGQRNSARPLEAAGLMLVLAGGFAAVKLLATLQFALGAPSVYTDFTGTPLRMIWSGLFNPRVPMVSAYRGTRYGGWEFGAYIGYVPAVLFLAGACLTAKRTWPWLVAAGVFLIAVMGRVSPVNFFSLFTAAPGLSGMHVPFRFIVHVLLAVAVVGAAGLDRLAEYAKRLGGRAAAAAVLAVVTVASAGMLVWMHYDRPVPLYGLASYLVPPAKYGGSLAGTEGLKRIEGEEGRFVPETFAQAVEVYEAFLDHRRLSWGYDAVHLECHASFPEQADYRGEAYVARPELGAASLKESSLSRYVVEYDTSGRALVVLNQNAYPGWVADGASGRAGDFAGLVAAPVEAGRGEVTFAYRPVTRPLGLFMTLVAAGAAGYWVTRRRRPPTKKERAKAARR